MRKRILVLDITYYRGDHELCWGILRPRVRIIKFLNEQDRCLFVFAFERHHVEYEELLSKSVCTLEIILIYES